MTHIKDVFEEKARSGEGAYAVAFALLELSEQQHKAACALDALGLNKLGSVDTSGCLEEVAIQLREISQALLDRES